MDISNLCEGVVLISGTGNACLGYKNGEYLLTGGGGQLLDEQGSAYSLVKQAVLQVKLHDEEGISYNDVDKIILKYFKAKNFSDLKKYFYEHTKAEVAMCAKHILELKSPNVDNLVKEQALFLVKQLIIQVRRLNFKNGAVLGLIGGFFKDNQLLIDTIKELMEVYSIHLNLVNNVDLVYLGALRLAKKNYLRGKSLC